jgi:hypothetical protein
MVHFSRFESTPSGDDDAPGDSAACEGTPRVVHSRPVRIAVIECQRHARRRGITVRRFSILFVTVVVYYYQCPFLSWD